VDATDKVWADEAPANALELGRTIFRAFAKRINGDKTHYDRLFKELVDKVKEKNNKLSDADAKELMKSWRESGVAPVRAPRSASPRRPAASSNNNTNMMDQWMREIRVAQDGVPANVAEIAAEMDRVLSELREREAHTADYESGRRIVGWHNPNGVFTSARIIAKNQRNQYYALTDTGGVETLAGPIGRIVGPAWADYRAHTIERGNTLTVLRERFPDVGTLYRVGAHEHSEYPLDGEQLHVPWAVEAAPSSDDKKGIASWKKRALALKAYFDNDASQVDMGQTTYTTMQDVWGEHVMLALLLKPADTHAVITCGAKAAGAFVGFFGGQWHDELKPGTDLFIEIKNSKKSRYLYYDKTLNLLSLAPMSHRRGEGNVRVVIKKTIGLLKGKFAIVVATKPIAMYDELVFEPNFGIHNQSGEEPSKIPTGAKRLHRHAQPPAAAGDDARGSSGAESSSSSGEGEREEEAGDGAARPGSEADVARRGDASPPPAAPAAIAAAPPAARRRNAVVAAVDNLRSALLDEREPPAGGRVLRSRTKLAKK
jgi:hypothetical protein